MKHRALVIGAGRIGAGYEWGDLEYTHAGAYRALADRVELVGFVEPEVKRAQSAKLKWEVPAYEDIPTAMAALKPDVVSVCVQPDQQEDVYLQLQVEKLKGIWQEKPFVVDTDAAELVPIQVNYMRRGDDLHRAIAEKDWGGKLIVYGKDDIHTRCHFEDLAKWWGVALDYRPFNGPCAYILKDYASGETWFFDNGGVDGGECFRKMLGNLLDHIEGKAELWSPANG